MTIQSRRPGTLTLAFILLLNQVTLARAGQEARPPVPSQEKSAQQTAAPPVAGQEGQAPAPAALQAKDETASKSPEGLPPTELSLREAIRMAVDRNLDIQVARMDPEQRKQDVIVARSLFDPTASGGSSRSTQSSKATSAFSATSSVTDVFDAGIRKEFLTGAVATLAWNNQRSAVQLGTASFQFANPTYRSELTLSFTQPLLKGFGAKPDRLNIVITRNNLLVSQSQVRRTLLTTVRDATNAYWDLAGAISDLDVANQALDLAKNLLKLNKAKVEVGTLAPIEITQAEAGVASREEAVIVAEAAIQTAERALRRVLNAPKDSDLWNRPIRPKDEPPFEIVHPDVEQAVSEALANRPELEQQRIQMKNLDLQAAIAQSAAHPQLDLTGSYGLSGVAGDRRIPVDKDNDGTIDGIVKIDQGFSDAWQQIGNADLPAWSVGLQATYPLGNRAAKAAYARAHVAAEQGRLSLKNAERGIEIEVLNDVGQVQTNVKRVQAARVNVDLQRKKLEAEQKRLQYGLSNSFQVLSFQNDLTAAQSSEVKAIIDYNKSLANLANATGTLLDKQGIVVQ